MIDTLEQTIASSASPARLIRALGFAVLVSGFAAAFLYDAKIGYPTRNAEEFFQSHGLATPSIKKFNPRLLSGVGRRLAETTAAGTELTALIPIIGEDGVVLGRERVFLGPGGRLAAEVEGTRIVRLTWTDGAKNDAEIQWQWWIGYVLSILSLGFIVHLSRVLKTRASAGLEGLFVSSHGLIPWSAIVGIRSVAGKSKTVEVLYRCEPRDQLLRLDDYSHGKFDDLLRVICDRTGLPNPCQSS